MLLQPLRQKRDRLFEILKNEGVEYRDEEKDLEALEACLTGNTQEFKDHHYRCSTCEENYLDEADEEDEEHECFLEWRSGTHEEFYDLCERIRNIEKAEYAAALAQ